MIINETMQFIGTTGADYMLIHANNYIASYIYYIIYLAK